MIKATIKGGRLEVDVPADWPDGTVVEVYAIEQGITRDVDVMSPEEIAQTLSAMDQMEPLEITDAERTEWEAEREVRTQPRNRCFGAR